MKKIVIGILLLVIAAIGALIIPNPLGTQVLAEAKYRGYLPYTADEAVSLAYSRCTLCHNSEKIIRYCSRCGPPFIVVSHSMKKYMELANQKTQQFKPFSDAELVAITQVWNSLIGNWEPDWGTKNLDKLLQGDQALIRLASTPFDERPIEKALKHKAAPGAHKEEQRK